MDIRWQLSLAKNQLRRLATHASRRLRGEQKIIASLTSYPPRIATVHLAIRSLLAQRTLPDLVILWLCTKDFPNHEADLPQDLLNILARDVQIRWVDRDLKPHKKYYWAFQEFRDDIVITFDDDLLYKNTLITELLDAHKEHPGCICASRTHLITFDRDGKINPYSEWIYEAPTKHSALVGQPRMDLFATTGAGTLFLPSLLPQETYNASAIEESCINADDIWLKTMQIIANIPVVASTPNQELEYIPESQHVALWHSNINEGDNDMYFTRLLSLYNVSLKPVDNMDFE